MGRWSARASALYVLVPVVAVSTGCVSYPRLFDCDAIGLRSVEPGSELRAESFSFPAPEGSWCVLMQEPHSIFLSSSPLMGQTLTERPSQYARAHSIGVMAAEVELREKGVDFDGEVTDQGFGWVTHFLIPGGVRVQLYEPRYERHFEGGS